MILMQQKTCDDWSIILKHGVIETSKRNVKHANNNFIPIH